MLFIIHDVLLLLFLLFFKAEFELQLNKKFVIYIILYYISVKVSGVPFGDYIL